MYYREPRIPSETDLQLIEGAGHIAVIAIKGERSQVALTRSDAELRTIIYAIRQLIVSLGADGQYKPLLDELKVNGVPERMQLAVEAGAKRILIPSENRRDIAEIPDSILTKIQWQFYDAPNTRRAHGPWIELE